MGTGPTAAASWIFRGHESRRRRGCLADKSEGTTSGRGRGRGQRTASVRAEIGARRLRYEALSEACAAAIALVDDAAPEDHHRHGVCPVLLGLAVFGVVAFLCLARKVRNKKRAVRAIFAAIRSDDVLKATVEAKAGVPVPEPCNCAGGRRLSVAFLVALCLSLLVGPPTVVVSALLAAAVSGCLKACRGRATVAPPDYEAVVAEEGKAPSAPSKEAAKTDSLLAAAKKDPKTVPLLK